MGPAPDTISSAKENTSMTTFDEAERNRRAFYAAGQAVAAHILGVRFGTVALEPGPDYRGLCDIEPMDPTPLHSRIAEYKETYDDLMAVDRLIVVTVAGLAATAALPQVDHFAPATHDQEHAEGIASAFTDTPMQARAVCEWQYRKAEALWHDPSKWAAAVPLARELEQRGRIGGGQARSIITAAMGA